MGKTSIPEITPPKSFFSSLLGNLPLIIAIVAVAFCYFLYRKIESNDTNESLNRFIMTSGLRTKAVEDKVNTIDKFLTAATSNSQENASTVVKPEVKPEVKPDVATNKLEPVKEEEAIFEIVKN